MKDNNKLIAEFMGLSIKEGVCYYTDADDMFPMGIEVEEPYLPYHTSWDWLMPVIEKIENDGLDPHGMIDNSLRKNNQKRWRSIEDLHNVAVYLINIYNNE
jgi:hypothetical protein|tara:strand:+ start:281 stop:583 length:303 start_codon:yes stop_codon:yes gene_type:complete